MVRYYVLNVFELYFSTTYAHYQPNFYKYCINKTVKMHYIVELAKGEHD